MKLVRRLVYSVILLVIGWLFNFIFDTNFALGVAAGWFMKEGYDSIAKYLLSLI